MLFLHHILSFVTILAWIAHVFYVQNFVPQGQSFKMPSGPATSYYFSQLYATLSGYLVIAMFAVFVISVIAHFYARKFPYGHYLLRLIPYVTFMLMVTLLPLSGALPWSVVQTVCPTGTTEQGGHYLNIWQQHMAPGGQFSVGPNDPEVKGADITSGILFGLSASSVFMHTML